MTTKHNHKPNFGRKINGCPRCEELKAGDPAVKGWGSRKAEAYKTFRRRLAEHDCKRSGCGPVCTAFEW